jgi:CRP/FNR family transcriptional regulator, anaerobic regulatory protein
LTARTTQASPSCSTATAAHADRLAGAPGVQAVSCGDCGLQDVCLVEGLTASELDRLAGMVATRRRIRRGETLFRAGDPFEAVYPIRVGFFKSRITSDDGREQVTGFPMPGDILGFDAISTGRFQCDAIALEDAEVCVVPFEGLEVLSREFSGLQQQLHRVLSREIVRDQGVMMLLGTMRAEQRIGTFLLNLSQRLQQRGFSPREFILRMTREEIGNYLGLKLETVSRAFSKLQEEGVIVVEQKHLRIEDLKRLREVAGASCSIE